MGYLNISYWRNKIINKREMLNEAQIYIICIEEQSQMKVIPNLNLKQAKL